MFDFPERLEITLENTDEAPPRDLVVEFDCEWTSAEARREAGNAGKHDRVLEIFSSTGCLRSVGRRRSHRQWITLSCLPGTVRV